MSLPTDGRNERLTGVTSTPESVWQAWLQREPVSPRSLHAWLPAGSRLVVLAPHPEDELLACGALLSMHVQRGGDALVIAATDDDRDGASGGGPQLDPYQRATQPGGRTRNQRGADHVDSLAQLGLREGCVKRLGLPHGRVHEHADSIERELHAVLQPSDVLLSSWRRDGQPDHEACGQSAARAAARARCQLIEAPMWMWHWARPQDSRVPWHRLQALMLDAPALRQKVAALEAHVSPLRARPAEYFFV